MISSELHGYKQRDVLKGRGGVVICHYGNRLLRSTIRRLNIAFDLHGSRAKYKEKLAVALMEGMFVLFGTVFYTLLGYQSKDSDNSDSSSVDSQESAQKPKRKRNRRPYSKINEAGVVETYENSSTTAPVSPTEEKLSLRMVMQGFRDVDRKERKALERSGLSRSSRNVQNRNDEDSNADIKVVYPDDHDPGMAADVNKVIAHLLTTGFPEAFQVLTVRQDPNAAIAFQTNVPSPLRSSSDRQSTINRCGQFARVQKNNRTSKKTKKEKEKEKEKEKKKEMKEKKKKAKMKKEKMKKEKKEKLHESCKNGTAKTETGVNDLNNAADLDKWSLSHMDLLELFERDAPPTNGDWWDGRKSV